MEWKEHIKKCIEICRQQPLLLDVDILGKQFSFDYRVFPAKEAAYEGTPIVHVPFASPWTYASVLPIKESYYLNRRTAVLSFWDEGLSSPTDRELYFRPDFTIESHLLLRAIVKLIPQLGTNRIIMSGHSNAFALTAMIPLLADDYGIEVEAVIGHNPAGIKTVYNYPGLLIRYGISGMKVRIAHKSDPGLISLLEPSFPSQMTQLKNKSCLATFKKSLDHSLFLAKITEKANNGHLLSVLKQLQRKGCPVLITMGGRDIVYPPFFKLSPVCKNRWEILDRFFPPGSVLWKNISEQFHNSTMFPDVVLTVLAISDLLKQAGR